MASNWINIGTTGRLAQEVRACVDHVQASVDKVRELKNMMAEFAGDWTALGAQLGVSDAEAQLVYNNFVNANTVLTGADINYFINRMS